MKFICSREIIFFLIFGFFLCQKSNFIPTYLPKSELFNGLFFLMSRFFGFFLKGIKNRFHGNKSILFQLLFSISTGKRWMFFSGIDFSLIGGFFFFFYGKKSIFTDTFYGDLELFAATFFARPRFQIFPFFFTGMILIFTRKKLSRAIPSTFLTMTSY